MVTSNKRQYDFTSQDVQESIEIIKKEEGFSEKAYPDPFSPRAQEKWKPKDKRRPDWESLPGTPWTIGYGRTGPDVTEATTTTRDQELFWLTYRVQEELNWLKKRGVPPCAGLVSLAYNIGRTAFERSNAYKAFQEGNFKKALEEMQGFNKSAGKIRPGLVKRRAKEAVMVSAWLARNGLGNFEVKAETDA